MLIWRKTYAFVNLRWHWQWPPLLAQFACIPLYTLLDCKCTALAWLLPGIGIVTLNLSQDALSPFAYDHCCSEPHLLSPLVLDSAHVQLLTISSVCD